MQFFTDGGPMSALNVVGVTREVVDNLRAIAAKDASRSPRAFMKIGDSITAGGGTEGAFGCFAAAESNTIDLGGRTELQPTVGYFDMVTMNGGRPSDSGQTTAWNRNSWSAVVSVDSAWPFKASNESGYGGATPVDKELSEMTANPPRFAVYMLGSNDIGGSPAIHTGNPGSVLNYYAGQVLLATENLTARGIIPVMTYIPPIPGRSIQSLWYSPAAGAVVRGIAVAKRLPTIDAYSEMEALGVAAAASGSAGPGWVDDIHPAAAPAGECVLTAANMKYGRNLRDLRTLEVLDKLRQVFADGAAAVDADVPAVAGAGTAASPLIIPSAPWAYASPSSGPEAGHLSDYRSCGGASGLNGNETVFRIDITAEVSLRALALAGDCADSKCSKTQSVTVALFKNSLDPANCVSAGFMVQRRFSPGAYYFVLDSATSSQPKTSVLTIHRCMDPDEDCKKCPATDASCVALP